MSVGTKQQQQQTFESLEAVKKAARITLKTTRIAAKKTPFTAAPSGSGNPVNVYISDIPGFGDLGKTALPSLAGKTQQDAMIEAVAGKMQAGKTKFDSLMTMPDDDFASHEREWRSVDGRDDCSCPRNPAP